MSTQRNTLVLIGFVVCALLLITIGIFYFIFRNPQDEQHNLDGTTLVRSNETVLGASSQTTGPIILFTPRANERVESPVSITGETALPQTDIYYRLKNKSGSILSSGYMHSEQKSAQATSTFEGTLAYTSLEGEKGTVEVFVLSDAGQEMFTVTIPIFYRETSTEIKK